MRTVRIGRSKSNDYVINDDSVSGSHAVLDLNADEQSGVLKDLNSTNGTYVNGRRISAPTPVSAKDTIRFGKTTLSIAEITSNPNRTRVSPKTPGVERKTIGKSEQSQIRYTQDDVSRNHAIIYKTADGRIVIEDCGSTNGTYVNGMRVTSRELQPGDRVTVTRNYPLEWEKIFSVSHSPAKPSTHTNITAVAAAVLFVVLIAGGAWWWYTHRIWSKERVYEEYSNAVCCVMMRYGYKVYVDNQDATSALFHTEYVCVNNDEIVTGMSGCQGTAFFISNDGKLATNLHITRPWLFSNDVAVIEGYVNQVLAAWAATRNPLMSRSTVRVEPVIGRMLIVLNGLPACEENAIEVDEYKGYDDIKKDVAVIQTRNRELPSRVKHIIDINDADLSEESLKQGRMVYTIGFPYGEDIAKNSNQELQNQIHSGDVSQNLGEYEFGHDAATAEGASGSPIINNRGKLVGIHHAGMTGVTGAQGFNRAIKAKYIYDLLKD